MSYVKNLSDREMDEREAFINKSALRVISSGGARMKKAYDGTEGTKTIAGAFLDYNDKPGVNPPIPPTVYPFISTWRTTAPSETLTIPTVLGSSYDCTVDWGDGTVEALSGHDDPKWAHQYAAAGDYQISINGTFERIRAFENPKLISVDQLGVVGWTSFHQAFVQCLNLTSFTVGNTDTSGVTAMSEMFNNCHGLTSLDLSAFDTSNVTTMSAMFLSTIGLTLLDVSSFDTSNVTNMSFMFQGCRVFTLDLSSFDTSLVTTMRWMFVNCVNLTAVPSLAFTPSAVLTDVENLFAGIGAGLSGVAPELWNVTNFPILASFVNAFTGATGLSNYADIPNNWKGL